MRRYVTPLAVLVLGLVVILCLPSSAAKKSAYGIAAFSKYVEIPGRHRLAPRLAQPATPILPRTSGTPFMRSRVLIANRAMVRAACTCKAAETFQRSFPSGSVLLTTRMEFA